MEVGLLLSFIRLFVQVGVNHSSHLTLYPTILQLTTRGAMFLVHVIAGG
jgi:hypothetical protein